MLGAAYDCHLRHLAGQAFSIEGSPRIWTLEGHLLVELSHSGPIDLGNGVGSFGSLVRGIKTVRSPLSPTPCGPVGGQGLKLNSSNLTHVPTPDAAQDPHKTLGY
eukprot:1448549-Prymnesium_polylepis.1